MPIKDPDYQLKKQLVLPGITEPEVGSSALNADDVRLRYETARNQLEGGKVWPKSDDGKAQVPEWYERVLFLEEGGWRWEVAVFICWLAQPKKYRWPKTQLELAVDILKLSSDRQLSLWRAKNPAIDTMAREIAAASVLHALPDSFAAMNEVAARADYKSRGDRELQFKLSGLLSDGGELKVTDGNLDEMLKQMPMSEVLRGAGLNTVDKIMARREKWARELEENTRAHLEVQAAAEAEAALPPVLPTAEQLSLTDETQEEVSDAE